MRSAAASALVAGLLDDGASVVEVARTRMSVHYETGRDDVPVVCVCTPGAVRLPNSVLTSVLPTGALVVRDGRLSTSENVWRVARWWQPPRPRGLTAPSALPDLGIDVPADLDPCALVGLGDGLTPSGDDVLAGALVAAAATDHPRLEEWRTATRAALVSRTTTAVSRGLLTHALDGWAVPELAEFVVAVCEGDARAAAARLRLVGHSSGTALAAGALHVLGGESLRGAA